MTKEEHNRLSWIKGALKRNRKTLHDLSHQLWRTDKQVAMVPGKGLASTWDAAREIHSAVLDCNAAIEMLEVICALPVDETDQPSNHLTTKLPNHLTIKPKETP